jgi:hypothetical protein
VTQKVARIARIVTGMAIATTTREHAMVIALECPWCEGVLLADESALDEGPRCEGCGIRFDLAPEAATGHQLADAA